MSEPSEISEPKANSIPAADISVNVSDSGVTTTHTFPVRQPRDYSNDFVVHVYASTLYRCRRKLEDITRTGFPINEVMLGLATTAVGAIAGAMASDIALASPKGIFFFVILPPFTGAFLVAYFFLRRDAHRHPSQIADEILDELPNPDQAMDIGIKQ